LSPYSPSETSGTASEFMGVACCSMLPGVAVLLESFYKPELDAAHNPRLQADKPSLSGGVLIPFRV